MSNHLPSQTDRKPWSKSPMPGAFPTEETSADVSSSAQTNNTVKASSTPVSGSEVANSASELKLHSNDGHTYDYNSTTGTEYHQPSVSAPGGAVGSHNQFGEANFNRSSTGLLKRSLRSSAQNATGQRSALGLDTSHFSKPMTLPWASSPPSQNQTSSSRPVSTTNTLGLSGNTLPTHSHPASFKDGVFNSLSSEAWPPAEKPGIAGSKLPASTFGKADSTAPAPPFFRPSSATAMPSSNDTNGLRPLTSSTQKPSEVSRASPVGNLSIPINPLFGQRHLQRDEPQVPKFGFGSPRPPPPPPFNTFDQHSSNIFEQQAFKFYKHLPPKPFKQQPPKSVEQQPSNVFRKPSSNVLEGQASNFFKQQPPNVSGQQTPKSNFFGQHPPKSSIFDQQTSTFFGQQPPSFSGQRPPNLSGQQTSSLFGQQPSSLSGPQPSSIFGQQPPSLFREQPSSLSGSQSSSIFGNLPTHLIGPQPSNLSGSQPSNLFGPKSSNDFKFQEADGRNAAGAYLASKRESFFHELRENAAREKQNSNARRPPWEQQEAPTDTTKDVPKPVASSDMSAPTVSEEELAHKERINALELQIDDLGKDNAAASSQLAEAVGLVNQLRAQNEEQTAIWNKQKAELHADHRKKMDNTIARKEVEKDSALQALKDKYAMQIKDADMKSKLFKEAQANTQKLEEKLRKLEKDVVDIGLAKAMLEKECQDLAAKNIHLAGFESGYQQIQGRSDELQTVYNDLAAECEELKIKLQSLEEATENINEDKQSNPPGLSSSSHSPNQLAARKIAAANHLNGLMNQWENQLQLKEQSLDQKLNEITEVDTEIANLQPSDSTSKPTTTHAAEDSECEEVVAADPEQHSKTKTPAQGTPPAAPKQPSRPSSAASTRTWAAIAGRRTPGSHTARSRGPGVHRRGGSFGRN